MKQLKKITIVLVTAIFLSLPAWAIDDEILEGDVPIDGGLSLLVAAGIGYGIKKVKQRKKAEGL